MEKIKIDIKRGKKIFENIQEYPLPKINRTNDYVFYMVPTNQGYGKGGEAFMDRYYKNHIKKHADSLEEIIDHLYDEVQSKQIDQIREIVIISHGNVRDLIFPVTKNAKDSQANKQKFIITREGTLRNLQIAFKGDNEHSPDPLFQNFRDKRKEVVKKLLDTSWITIRACQFGVSADGLYALYSFFGGRANVYAPRYYQFFTDELHIGVNNKITSEADLFRHLIKQGYFPRSKTKLSRNRAVSVTNSLIDHPKSRVPFKLSGYTFEQGRVVNGNREEHGSFIDKLNQKEVPDEIKNIFVGNGLPLSSNAKVSVNKKIENTIWRITDRISIELTGGKNHEYDIDYMVKKEFDNFFNEDNYTESLNVYAFLDHKKSQPSIPVQMFFDDRQHEIYNGQLFSLASYEAYKNLLDQDIVIKNNADKGKYDDLVTALDSENLQNSNIAAIFDHEGYTLTNPRAIKVSEGKEWVIEADEGKFTLIRKFSYVPRTKTGESVSINVFKAITWDYQEDFIDQTTGADPNTMGPELLAYLDNKSIEELVDLLFFLRDAYKEEYAFYIRMAQYALSNKIGFYDWFKDIGEFEKVTNEPLYFSPFEFLNEVEDKHYRTFSYKLEPWRDIKASKSRNQDFESDLFEEKDLPFSPEELGEVKDPDSPAQDPNLPRQKVDPPAKFFEHKDNNRNSKESVFFSVNPDRGLNCQEFKEVLELLLQHSGEGEEELKSLLRKIETSDGLVYDFLKANGFKIKKDHIDALSKTYDTLKPFITETEPKKYMVYILGTSRATALAGFLEFYDLYAFPIHALTNILKKIQQGADAHHSLGLVTGLVWARLQIRIINDNYVNHGINYADSYELNNPGHVKAYETIKMHEFIAIGLSNFNAHEQGYLEGFQLGNKLLNESLGSYGSFVRKFATEKGLNDCQAKVLLESGLVDINKIRINMLINLIGQLNDLIDKAQIHLNAQVKEI